MAWETLIAAVEAVITDNDNNEITGEVLRTILTQNIIPQLGQGEFKGFATVSTNPGTTERDCFYIANELGTYPSFAGIEVTKALTFLKHVGGAWTKVEANVGDNFLGFIDPFTNPPAITDATGKNGEYYVASKSGAVNTGGDNIIIGVGDVLKHNGSIWRKDINNNQYSIDEQLKALKPYFTKKLGGLVADTNTSPYWDNEGSTFSGWGSGIGQQPAFNSVKLWVRSFNPAEPVTKLTLKIRENNSSGAILSQKTVDLSNINGEELIIYLDDLIDTATPLWLEYFTDGRIGRYRGTTGGDVAQNAPTMYSTNKDLKGSGLVLVSGSPLQPIYAQLYNATKELEFTQEAITFFTNLNQNTSLVPFFETESNLVSQTTSQDGFQLQVSTFSAWGCGVGVRDAFNAIRLKVRTWKVDEPITQIRVRVRENDYNGTVLADKTVSISTANINDEIKVVFDNEVDSNELLFVEFLTDGRAGYSGSATDEDIGQGATPLRYNTSKSLSASVSTAVTSGQQKPIRYEFLSTNENRIELTAEGIALLQSALDVSETPPRIILPDSFDAVIGYKQQLFYRGLIEDIDPFKWNIKVTGNVGGRQYPRYYEFTPTSTGTKTFTISLYDKGNNLVATASCDVIVRSAANTSPASIKRVLCVGDSLTANGIWVGELQRMLAQSGGTPTALGLSNIDFIGTVDQGNGNQYEGYGGKTWGWFISETTSPDVDFTVTSHDKDNSDLVSVWADGNGNEWTLETVGSGTLLIFSRNNHTADAPASGVLTHVSGANHTGSITYTGVENNSGTAVNKFWNSSTDQLDFTNYIGTNGFVDVDYVVALLTWNGMAGDRATADSHTGLINDAKVFIDKLHQQYPDAKVKLLGIQLPSMNGGLAQNYGDGTSNYGNYYALVRTVMGLNLAYQELANDPAYSSFVDFINVSGQFDTLYNMPYGNRAVNSRNATTEIAGTNGVHPSSEGYLQIADAAFRNMNKEF